MHICPHESIGGKFKQFSRIDNKSAGNRRCINPFAIFPLNAQAGDDILQQHSNETAVLMRAHSLLTFRYIAPRITDNLQELGWMRLINLGEKAFRLPQSRGDGLENINANACHLGLISKQQRLKFGQCFRPLVRADQTLPCRAIRTDLGRF